MLLSHRLMRSVSREVRRPTVLFVINSFSGGGAERVMATLIAASRDKLDQYEIAVAVLDREVCVYPLPEWVKQYQLDARGSWLRSIFMLHRLTGELRPDLTVSFLTRANIAALVAMGLRRRKSLISERVNTRAHLGSGGSASIASALVRLTYPHASKVISVSKGVGQTLSQDFGVAADKIVTIHNPVDLQVIRERCAEPPSINIDEPYVVAMGRLVPNKNFQLLVRAFAEAGRPGKLVILGEGPERKALTDLGDQLGLGERLVMSGFVENPYSMLARAEVMVLSSNAEGFPNALVEGLACGVPVVATDCPSGPREVLGVSFVPEAGSFESGLGGLLVPMDDVAAMTSALRHLADPARQAALREQGQARVKKFSVESSVRSYWSAIAETLGVAEEKPKPDNVIYLHPRTRR